jgi:peptidoglycan/LPS O-acetylase OafA/YrhL
MATATRTPMAAAGTMRLPRIDALTSVRFFAALWVVLFHHQEVVSWPVPVLAVAQHGSLGVSLFFVLSGFILTYTYHGTFQPGTVLRRYPSFLWARFSRIYPMYLFSVVLYTPLALWGNLQAHGVGVTAASWLANAGMVQSLWPDVVLLWGWNRSLWSIPTEFVFYLMQNQETFSGMARWSSWAHW